MSGRFSSAQIWAESAAYLWQQSVATPMTAGLARRYTKGTQRPLRLQLETLACILSRPSSAQIWAESAAYLWQQSVVTPMMADATRFDTQGTSWKLRTRRETRVYMTDTSKSTATRTNSSPTAGRQSVATPKMADSTRFDTQGTSWRLRLRRETRVYTTGTSKTTTALMNVAACAGRQSVATLMMAERAKRHIEGTP